MAQEINRGPGPDPTPDGPPDKPGPAGQRAHASGQPRARAGNREAAANPLRDTAIRRRTAMTRAAAVLAWVAGLGFGLPCLYAISYLAKHGRVWTFLGFPTYGGGPFEDIGIRTTVPLLSTFALVCAAELVAGWMLWQHRRPGHLLALALLPLELAFWIGFLLPLGPLVGLARTVLVIAARAPSTAPNGPRPPS